MMLRLLSLVSCISAIAAANSLPSKVELSLTSNSTFEAGFELIFELTDDFNSTGRRELKAFCNKNSAKYNPSKCFTDVFDDEGDGDDDDDDDDKENKALFSQVQNKAFGSEALDAIKTAVKEEITKDDKCMAGVEIVKIAIDYQELDNPQAFDPTIKKRKLQINNRVNWILNVGNIQGKCIYCGGDNGDRRRLGQAVPQELRNLRELQANPGDIETSCQSLAKQILQGVAQTYALIPNVERFGIKMINPNLSLTQQIIVWYDAKK